MNIAITDITPINGSPALSSKGHGVSAMNKLNEVSES